MSQAGGASADRIGSASVAIEADLNPLNEGLAAAHSLLQQFEQRKIPAVQLSLQGLTEGRVALLERAAVAMQKMSRAQTRAAGSAMPGAQEVPVQREATSQQATGQHVKVEISALSANIRQEIEAALREPFPVKLTISNLGELQAQLGHLNISVNAVPGAPVAPAAVHVAPMAAAATATAVGAPPPSFKPNMDLQRGLSDVNSRRLLEDYYNRLNDALKRTGQEPMRMGDFADDIERAANQMHVISQRFGAYAVDAAAGRPSEARYHMQITGAGRNRMISGGTIAPLIGSGDNADMDLVDAALAFVNKTSGPGRFMGHYRDSAANQPAVAQAAPVMATAAQSMAQSAATMAQAAQTIAHPTPGSGAMPPAETVISNIADRAMAAAQAEQAITRQPGFSANGRTLVEIVQEMQRIGGATSRSQAQTRTALSFDEETAKLMGTGKERGYVTGVGSLVARRAQGAGLEGARQPGDYVDLLPFFQGLIDPSGGFVRLAEELEKGQGTGRFFPVPNDMYGNPALKPNTKAGNIPGYGPRQFRALTPSQLMERTLLAAGVDPKDVEEVLGQGGMGRGFIEAAQNLRIGRTPEQGQGGLFAPGSRFARPDAGLATSFEDTQERLFASIKHVIGRVSDPELRASLMDKVHQNIEEAFETSRAGNAANRERIHREATVVKLDAQGQPVLDKEGNPVRMRREDVQKVRTEAEVRQLFPGLDEHMGALMGTIQGVLEGTAGRGHWNPETQRYVESGGAIKELVEPIVRDVASILGVNQRGDIFDITRRLEKLTPTFAAGVGTAFTAPKAQREMAEGYYDPVGGKRVAGTYETGQQAAETRGSRTPARQVSKPPDTPLDIELQKLDSRMRTLTNATTGGVLASTAMPDPYGPRRFIHGQLVPQTYRIRNSATDLLPMQLGPRYQSTPAGPYMGTFMREGQVVQEPRFRQGQRRRSDPVPFKEGTGGFVPVTRDQLEARYYGELRETMFAGVNDDQVSLIDSRAVKDFETAQRAWLMHAASSPQEQGVSREEWEKQGRQLSTARRKTERNLSGLIASRTGRPGPDAQKKIAEINKTYTTLLRALDQPGGLFEGYDPRKEGAGGPEGGSGRTGQYIEGSRLVDRETAIAETEAEMAAIRQLKQAATAFGNDPRFAGQTREQVMAAAEAEGLPQQLRDELSAQMGLSGLPLGKPGQVRVGRSPGTLGQTLFRGEAPDLPTSDETQRRYAQAMGWPAVPLGPEQENALLRRSGAAAVQGARDIAEARGLTGHGGGGDDEPPIRVRSAMPDDEGGGGQPLEGRIHVWVDGPFPLHVTGMMGGGAEGMTPGQMRAVTYANARANLGTQDTRRANALAESIRAQNPDMSNADMREALTALGYGAHAARMFPRSADTGKAQPKSTKLPTDWTGRTEAYQAQERTDPRAEQERMYERLFDQAEAREKRTERKLAEARTRREREYAKVFQPVFEAEDERAAQRFPVTTATARGEAMYADLFDRGEAGVVPVTARESLGADPAAARRAAAEEARRARTEAMYTELFDKADAGLVPITPRAELGQRGPRRVGGTAPRAARPVGGGMPSAQRLRAELEAAGIDKAQIDAIIGARTSPLGAGAARAMPGAETAEDAYVLQAQARLRRVAGFTTSRSLSTTAIQVAQSMGGGREQAAAATIAYGREVQDLKRISDQRQVLARGLAQAQARVTFGEAAQAEAVRNRKAVPNLVADLDDARKAVADHTAALAENEVALGAQKKVVDDLAKDLPGLGAAFKNIGQGFIGGIGGGFLVSAMSAVTGVISEAFEKGLVPQLDRRMGNALLTAEQNRTFAGAVAQGNYTERGVRQRLFELGFGAQGSNAVMGGLMLGAGGLAGAGQAQGRIDATIASMANLRQAAQLGLPQGVSPQAVRTQGALVSLPNPFGGFINLGGEGSYEEKLRDFLKQLPAQPTTGAGAPMGYSEMLRSGEFDKLPEHVRSAVSQGFEYAGDLGVQNALRSYGVAAPTLAAGPMSPEDLAAQQTRDWMLSGVANGGLRSGTLAEVNAQADIVGQSSLLKGLAEDMRRAGVVFTDEVTNSADALKRLQDIFTGRQSVDTLLQADREKVLPDIGFRLGLQMQQQRRATAIGAAMQGMGNPLGTFGAGIAGGPPRDLLDEASAAERQLGTYREADMGVLRAWAGPEAKAAIDQAEGLRERIKGIADESAGIQAAATWREYSHSLMLAKRQVGDLAALTGQGQGTELGRLERLNMLDQRRLQNIGFERQQRELNYRQALAGFTYEGATPEEAADRARIERIRAREPQRELNINRQIASRGIRIVDAQNLRAFQEAVHQQNELQKRFSEQTRLQALGELSERLGRLQARLQGDINTFIADADALEQAGTEYVQSVADQTGKTIREVYEESKKVFLEEIKTAREQMEAAWAGETTEEVPANSSGSPDDRNNTGNSRVPFMGGRNRLVFNLAINNPVVRNDDDIREIARQVEQVMNRKAGLMGVRRLRPD